MSFMFASFMVFCSRVSYMFLSIFTSYILALGLSNVVIVPHMYNYSVKFHTHGLRIRVSLSSSRTECL
jgi:hypothetical protein